MQKTYTIEATGTESEIIGEAMVHIFIIKAESEKEAIKKFRQEHPSMTIEDITEE